MAFHSGAPNKGVIESIVSSDDTMGIKQTDEGAFFANIIDDTDVYPMSNNSGHRQVIILRVGALGIGRQLFKIDIKVESYWFQSYVHLYVLNKNNDWTLLQSYFPSKMFNIDEYSITKNPEAWAPIYRHLGQLIMDLMPMLDQK